ncbi:hypothetical protein K457DRAFT_23708 [Linnemannia elongata AG-77]|uniref:RNI-like protein n=1 Tax=Linnemannia elongata AG-77 TaxID=1314771 RepID=A0A197JJV7_9FUNG|nr:hypothetical protein K457DRAFT_23708 [Linnemannia elongata AG-77]
MINSTLITLNLESNNIGNNGAQALSRALKTNSTVTISGPVLPDKSLSVSTPPHRPPRQHQPLHSPILH